MTEIVEHYNLQQTKKFLKAINGHKFECFYKLIFAYRLSRFELLNLEWDDIDFEKDTITIYPVSYIPSERTKSYWEAEKLKDLSRIYPLLPNIKQLLLHEKERQVNNLFNKSGYCDKYTNFICVKSNGQRLNANTFSRNLKYIARDNNLPEVLISGIKDSANEFFGKHITNSNYLCCWFRRDIGKRRENAYGEYNLVKNKRFVDALNNLIDRTETKQNNQDNEM